ncbi:hypothetical protein CcaverHIS002_0200140 [Cutaneotrichosporon cavernicola]|uniref:Uncharacterized protein n=1 Tax=Cutaneotrichosporon cavernicola TaxID=279322 RepID=A0AA48L2E8_9TREE|nr:uncharacterized protein CcaverHIS019_0200200 [Cutaneotrichosporon cavernicola]BEI80854.1 hypothetical protein CcaverHIS002_0200140 [Cutaneotrichosporon cavernicola]BEI88658.1 hypothetical protein CcaverHIS019_0200200 [Cutaneotrichosporon cavernicola]BEI96431.1 hypothetical protein CcaverHIS631_0200200 [Cutaneotrichosporon cavernicola]BEJ04203.1 hypothetical protein CcaverHIS641_0200200 [Cutaneotrichosporon cavernicola]
MRVPGSPKPRSPSPNRAQRQHLRPLLLANRARTTLTLPKPTFNRALISSPRNYKMTKSAADRSESSLGSISSVPAAAASNLIETSHVTTNVTNASPEIKVTPPVNSPALCERTVTASLEEFQVPERSSSLGATATSQFPATQPNFAQEDHRFLAPHYVTLRPPVPPRNSPWHTNPSHVGVYTPRPVVSLPPHSARRVGDAWDGNFMPTISRSGAQQPITKPSGQLFVYHHDEDIGHAL